MRPKSFLWIFFMAGTGLFFCLALPLGFFLEEELFWGDSLLRTSWLPRPSILWGLSGVGCLFMGLLTVFLHHFVRRPLLDIHKECQRFEAKEDFVFWKKQSRNKRKIKDDRVPFPSFSLGRVHHRDEMGRLAVSLEELVEKIQQELARQGVAVEATEENNSQLISEIGWLLQQRIDTERRIKSIREELKACKAGERELGG